MIAIVCLDAYRLGNLFVCTCSLSRTGAKAFASHGSREPETVVPDRGPHSGCVKSWANQRAQRVAKDTCGGDIRFDRRVAVPTPSPFASAPFFVASTSRSRLVYCP